MDYGDILMKRYKGEMLDYSEAFFAFSQEQLEEGMAKIGVTDKSLIVAGPINGLCGTNDGINKFMYSYKNEEENFKKLVKENCTPQQVYNFEFNNYECGYIWNGYVSI